MDKADVVEQAEAPAPKQDEAPKQGTPARESVEAGRRRVNPDALFWAGILIWTGAVLFASNAGYLDWFTYQGGRLAWNLPFRPSAWRLVFLGAAVIVGAQIAVHQAVPRYRRNVLGYLILVIIFVSLGLGYVNAIWPAILIVVGIALMMRSRRGD